MNNKRWQYSHIKTNFIERNWLWGPAEDRLVVYNDFSDEKGNVITEKTEFPITLPHGLYFKVAKIDSQERIRKIGFYFDHLLFKLGKEGWKLVSYQSNMHFLYGIYFEAILERECEVTE